MIQFPNLSITISDEDTVSSIIEKTLHTMRDLPDEVRMQYASAAMSGNRDSVVRITRQWIVVDNSCSKEHVTSSEA